MKLYHASSSPDSRRVRIFIAEKGLGIDPVPATLSATHARKFKYLLRWRQTS
jgi:glutathione S-transferase